VINVFDVVKAVDVAFRAGGSAFWPNCIPSLAVPCEDVNCDGVVNVFDVVILVDIAFRSGSPDRICDPCLCSQYPTNCP
jgi:hypothetical protein